MSPYEDRYIDVKFIGEISGPATLTVEDEFQRWRLLCLAFGFVLLLLASVVSSWVPFYYSSSMEIGVLLVIIILLFQMNQLRAQGLPEATDDLWSLANGPSANVDPYSKPYKGVDFEAWVYMIDHVWLDGDYQNLAKKARDSRARLPYNHTMGSKSFQAAMYKQSTKKTDFVDFYKDSHLSKRKSDWVTPICDQLHEALKKRHEESLEPGAIPLTQEHLSIEILGKKSGYLKGFGVGPKPSSSRSSVTAQAHTEVVSSLQKELESLKNLSKVQQEQIRLFIRGILLTNTFIGNGGK